MLTSFILIVHMHLDNLLGIPDPLSCLLAHPGDQGNLFPQPRALPQMKMCMFFFCPGAVFPTKAWTPSQRTDIGATSPRTVTVFI